MRLLLYGFAALLRFVGLVLGGSVERERRPDGVGGLGYPDVMKLGSTHVDPYRTGPYSPWTSKDGGA